MYEAWKRYFTFVDNVNIITKLGLGVFLFFFVIFVHNFDVMIYLTSLMLIFLLVFGGMKFKVTALFVLYTIIFSIVSALFMIFYGDGTHTLFKLGIINITTESLVRGLHLSMRTDTVTFFGIVMAFTSQIVMIFYSLMQHLKVKPKVAYAFMAAIRMVPLIISSFVQLRKSLKMRYQMVDKANYRGFARMKHLIIPLLSQNIRKAHQLQWLWRKKDSKTVQEPIIITHRSVIVISSLSCCLRQS